MVILSSILEKELLDKASQFFLSLDKNLNVDRSHYLWLITYFLKFASQLEVEMEQIRFGLNF